MLGTAFVLTVLFILVGLIALLVFAWLRKLDMQPQISFNKADIGDDPDAYVQSAEQKVGNVRPGARKTIIWNNIRTKARTPCSVVYIHGFTASMGEIRPVPDLVSAALGANRFYTRLRGHGVDESALANATLDEWLDDVVEAIAIGEAIGERVVVMATSTGAALATLALCHPRIAQKVAAVVLVSPNFGLKAKGAFLLNAPFARQIAHMILGRKRQTVPVNDLQSQIWYGSYPTGALLPMARAVSLARRADVAAIKIPALLLFCHRDQIVDPAITRTVADKWGGNVQLCPIENTEDPNGHVLAGDACSPATTTQAVALMVDWLKLTLGAEASNRHKQKDDPNS